jgi:hypothetical protein
MSSELPEGVPLLVRPVQPATAPLIEVTAPAHTTPAPTPEQARTAEAVFAQHEKESATVAGLLGMWTGTLLLHDVLKDTCTPPAGELEEEEAKKKGQEK